MPSGRKYAETYRNNNFEILAVAVYNILTKSFCFSGVVSLYFSGGHSLNNRYTLSYLSELLVATEITKFLFSLTRIVSM